MQYVCDAPGRKTWFRLESEAEAIRESEDMHHAVEKFFSSEQAKARASFRPTGAALFEAEIGLKAHLDRTAPLFLTLRDEEGTPLVTAMLPPGGRPVPSFRSILVGFRNGDPYSAHGDAILALARHYGLPLDREHCYPYRR